MTAAVYYQTFAYKEIAKIEQNGISVIYLKNIYLFPGWVANRSFLLVG